MSTNERAADMLTAYAELIKATGKYAEMHYIPEIEHVVSELRSPEAREPAQALPQGGEAEEALRAIMRTADSFKEPCGMDPESPAAIRNGKFATIAQIAAQGLGLVRGPALSLYAAPTAISASGAGVPVDEEAIGAACYRGNTVSFMYDKAKAYGDEIMRVWFVLKDAGKHPGRTDDPLHEAVRRALASPPPLEAGKAVPESLDAAIKHLAHCWGHMRWCRETSDAIEAVIAAAGIERKS